MNTRPKIFLFTILTLLLTTSCSSLQEYTQSQTFVIDKQWARSSLSSINPGFFKNHVAEPVVVGSKLLVANGYDGIGLYKQRNGREVWKFKIKRGVESNPIVNGDKVFVGGNDGYFYSLKLSNGKVAWKFPIRFEGLGSPIIQDESVYFTTGNHTLYSLNIKTGQANWTYIRKVDSSISVRGQGEVLVDGDTVYSGFSDGYFIAFKKSTGAVIWEKKLNSNRRFKDIDSSPVLFGDTIYVSGYDNNLYALNKSTGSILWQSPYGSHTKALLINDRIYSSTSQGEFVALDKITGKLIWKAQLKGGIATSPTYFKGFLIVGESDGQVVALSQVNGEQIASFDTGAGVKAKITPAQKEAHFFALSKGGNIFKFKMGFKKASEFWPWDN